MSEIAVTPETTTTPTTPETTPTTTPATATPTTPSYTYPEDRSSWVPPQRFTAAERATNLAARERDQLRSELASERARIAALAGATPKTPEAEEADRVAKAFYSLPQFSHLQKLTPEAIERLSSLLEKEGDFKAAAEFQYKALATDTLRDIGDKVIEAAGYDVDRGLVEDMFKAYVNRLAKDDPETTIARYEGRDPSLKADFVKLYTEKFIEPVRRQGYRETARQGEVRVPRSGPGQPVVTQQPKTDYSKMKTVSEMLAAAEQEADGYFQGNGSR